MNPKEHPITISDLVHAETVDERLVEQKNKETNLCLEKLKKQDITIRYSAALKLETVNEPLSVMVRGKYRDNKLIEGSIITDEGNHSHHFTGWPSIFNIAVDPESGKPSTQSTLQELKNAREFLHKMLINLEEQFPSKIK